MSWKFEWLYLARFDDRAKGIREFRIAVMDEISAITEKPPFIHGCVSGDLFHPGFVGMWRDPRDLNATALQMVSLSY